MLQRTSDEAALLIRTISAIINPVTDPVMTLDAMLVLAQETLALALHIHAPDRFIRPVQTVSRSVADQILRDAHLVRTGKLELAAGHGHMGNLKVFTVFLVIPKRTIVVPIAQERSANTGSVVVFTAVPLRTAAQEVVTSNLVAPIGTISAAVAAGRLRYTGPVIARELLLRGAGTDRHHLDLARRLDPANHAEQDQPGGRGQSSGQPHGAPPRTLLLPPAKILAITQKLPNLGSDHKQKK